MRVDQAIGLGCLDLDDRGRIDSNHAVIDRILHQVANGFQPIAPGERLADLVESANDVILTVS
jgi:hypothetical protein